MFCQECGAKLKDTAKFCGECGAKVERVEPTADKQVIDSIALSELPKISSIATMPVEILEVNGEGPDGENNFNITVKCRFNNESDQEWHLLKIRTQLLNAFGQVIEENIDKQEEFVGANDQFEWETSFWSVNADLLGSEPEKVHVIVYASASQKLEFELGQVHLPETSLSTVNVPAKNMEAMQLVSCSLWKGSVDDDKESRVEVRALLQNLTNSNVPLVKILAVVSDKQGDELLTFDGDDELRAGELSVINASSYAKDKKLVGAKVALSLDLYWFIATGIAQRQGMEILMSINDTENDNDDNDDENDDFVVPEEVKEIFNNLEDSMMEKSVLVGIAPSSMVAVSLTPAFYKDGIEKKLKCTINIECTEFEDLDDDTLEALSDAASDYFRDHDLKNDLDELGLEDILDWWPVKVINVNDDKNSLKTESNGERIILVSFAMTKGEGELPQFSKLSQDKQTIDFIVSCMEFSPSFDDVEENIVAWKVVDSGLGNLTFDKNGLKGYPNPIVEFKVCNVEDDDDFLRGVWESSYRLEIPELNEGDAYYFEDHNGYARIVEAIGNENKYVSGDSSSVECVVQGTNMINNVKMSETEFHVARTAYTSNAMFIAILANPELEYDHAAIGSAIFPNGFRTIDPPGPSFGFGSIVLNEDEEDGKVVIAELKVREDEDGKVISSTTLKESFEEYFDGFFKIDKTNKSIKQISFLEFYKNFKEEKDYKVIHFCEFEPNEDD